MQCIYCKYPDSHVVTTWEDSIRNIIKRRRECLKCGMRYTTEEKLRDIPRRGVNEHKSCP